MQHDDSTQGSQLWANSIMLLQSGPLPPVPVLEVDELLEEWTLVPCPPCPPVPAVAAVVLLPPPQAAQGSAPATIAERIIHQCLFISLSPG
jgi:hypothetical protein